MEAPPWSGWKRASARGNWKEGTDASAAPGLTRKGAVEGTEWRKKREGSKDTGIITCRRTGRTVGPISHNCHAQQYTAELYTCFRMYSVNAIAVLPGAETRTSRSLKILSSPHSPFSKLHCSHSKTSHVSHILLPALPLFPYLEGSVPRSFCGYLLQLKRHLQESFPDHQSPFQSLFHVTHFYLLMSVSTQSSSTFSGLFLAISQTFRIMQSTQ